MRSLLFAVLYLNVVNALSIFWPATIDQNSQTIVTWEGQPTFDIVVMSSPTSNTQDGSGTVVTQAQNLTDTQFQWTVNVAVGQNVFYILSDSSGAVVQSDPVVITPDPSSQPTSNSQNQQTTTTPRQSTSTSHTPSPQTSAPPSSTPSPTPSSTHFSPTSTPSPTSSTPSPSSNTVSTPTSDTESSPASTTSSSSLALPSELTDGGNGPSNDAPTKDNSIPYIIGILSGLAVICILAFAWRFVRARRRRALVAKSNMYFSDGKNPSPSFHYSAPLSTQDVYVAPPERRWSDQSLLRNNSSSNEFSRTGGNDLVSRGNARELPVSSGTTSHGHSNGSGENIGMLDNARASSVMLPPVAHAPDPMPLPSHGAYIPLATQQNNSRQLTPPLSSSPSPTGSRHSRRLSVPSSPNPFDEAVFDISPSVKDSSRYNDHTGYSQHIPLDIQMPSALSVSAKQHVPLDARSDSDGFSIFSDATAPRTFSTVPPLNLGGNAPSNSPLKRTATRADREYPTSPMTPYTPVPTTSTTQMTADSGAFIRQMFTGSSSVHEHEHEHERGHGHGDIGEHQQSAYLAVNFDMNGEPIPRDANANLTSGPYTPPAVLRSGPVMRVGGVPEAPPHSVVDLEMQSPQRDEYQYPQRDRRNWI